MVATVITASGIVTRLRQRAIPSYCVATVITASGIVFITLVITEKKKDVATIKSKVSLRPCFV